MKKIIIIGAGGHGRALAESILIGADFDLIGFVDDSWPTNKSVWDYPILGKCTDLHRFRADADYAIVAIGNNKLRQMLQKCLSEAGFSLATVIHPRATISPSAFIGSGVAIMACAIIGTEAHIGNGVIVNSGANIDHHCQVDDFAHLGVNACMAGGSKLGKRVWIQAGSALGYGVSLACDTVVAPGEAISIQ